MKKIYLVLSFFVLAPIVVFSILTSLVFIEGPRIEDKRALGATDNLFQSPKSGVQVYASLPDTLPSVSGSAQAADARAELVRQYLATYTSPLEPHADFIVQMADQYGLDFRLTTAIAQQESNLCKKMPAGTYNCWGWGIHSQGTLGFDSYQQGIETVSMGLKQDYLDQGLATPVDIMGRYTPLSDGSWAFGVETFMLEMQ